MDVALLALRLALAALFALAAIAKLRDVAATRRAVTEFGLPAAAAAPAAWALPALELAAAGLLVPAATAPAGALLALALLLLFVIAIALALSRGRRPECNCFGAVHSEPAGPLTLARNLALAALAALLAAAGPGESLAGLQGATVAAVAASLGGAVLLGLVWFSWQLFQQNGRLLARVRALEEVTGLAEPERPLGGGLPLGSPLPDLVLAARDGSPRSLAELVRPGTTLALVFADPGCGGCRELAARLPALREELGGAFEPVLVSRGGDDYGAEVLAFVDVLAQRDREALAAFRVAAVPAAVLVDDRGLIASEPAIGPREVERLLRTLAGRPPELELVEVIGGMR